MEIVHAFLIILAFIFILILWLTFTELMSPRAALKKKERHSTVLSHLIGTDIIGSVIKSIAASGGYRLLLFSEGWYVYSEPMTFYSYGYFHLVRFSGTGIVVKTVCRQTGSVFDKTIHQRFTDTVSTMVGLESNQA